MATNRYGMSYWGHGNCARLPSLHNYERAKAHYDSVIPIRGRAEECRPLGAHRRFSYYEIRKNVKAIQVKDDPLGQFITTYSCNLYRSDCVEYYPDGKIAIRTNGWHTPTTLAFVNYVTQQFGKLVSVKGRWYWQVTGTDKMFKIPVARGSELLLSNVGGEMIPENPIEEKRYAVKRKVMNAIRKRYDFFIDYGSTMLKMNNVVEKFEIKQAVHTNFRSMHLVRSHYDGNGTNRDNLAKLFSSLDKVIETNDLDLMYELAMYVANVAGRWAYNSQSMVCDAQRFVDLMNESIKYHFRDVVFSIKEVELGVALYDRNEKYFL
jgi:hypothetical protein